MMFKDIVRKRYSNDDSVYQPYKENMVLNAEGAYVFPESELLTFKKYLVLGAVSTYYSLEARQASRFIRLTEGGLNHKEQASLFLFMIKNAYKHSIFIKPDYTLFALAVACNSSIPDIRKEAIAYIPEIRTASHFLMFIFYLKQIRGTGQAVKRAVADWYNTRSTAQLTYQMVKYPERNDVSHKLVFTTYHPKLKDEHQDIVRYHMYTDTGNNDLLEHIFALKDASLTEAELIDLIDTLYNVFDFTVTHDMLTPEQKKYPRVWMTLAHSMPYGALIRNLSTMSRVGCFENKDFLEIMIDHITNTKRIKNVHMHPYHIFKALMVYKSAKGRHSTWHVYPKIVRALNEAVGISQQHYKPTGKRLCVGFDISASMGWNNGPLTCYEMEAFIGKLLLEKEKTTAYMFSHYLMPVEEDVYNFSYYNFATYLQNQLHGATNPGLLFEKAIEYNTYYDAFVVFTDSEVNTGHHVMQLFDTYRQMINPDAKLIIMAMAPNEYNLADIRDPAVFVLPGIDDPVVLETILLNF